MNRSANSQNRTGWPEPASVAFVVTGEHIEDGRGKEADADHDRHDIKHCIGGEVMSGFGLAIIFGIVIGTSSSIFIASPILLFLGEKRLRPFQTRAPQPSAHAAAP